MLVEVSSAPPSAIPSDLYQPNLRLTEPQDSITVHLLLYIVQLIALICPPFTGRRTLFIVSTIYLAIQAQLHPHFSNDPGQVQPFTISWSYYLATIEKFLFSLNGNPEESFWRSDHPAREATAFRAFGFSKLKWALMLMFNQRGIRWNFEVKNVPTVKSPSLLRSRVRFIFFRLVTVAYYILMGDLMFQLSIRLFFTASEDGTSTSYAGLNSKYLTLEHPQWYWQLAKCYVFAATPYFMISAQYNLFSIVAVALHLSQPADWPPLFNDLAGATTVRDLWGRCWHQQLRRMLSTYTTHLVDALGIRRGTNLSSYTQLWTAFTVSGLFHALSQRNMPAPANIAARDKVDGVFWFFVAQAAAITAEDFLVWLVCRKLLRRDVPRVVKTAVGYVWVLAVLWYTVPMAGDTFLRMRMGAESFLPFSVWKELVERYVPVPPLVIRV